MKGYSPSRIITGYLWMAVIVGVLGAPPNPASAQSSANTRIHTVERGAGFISYRLDEWTIGEGLPGHVSDIAYGVDGYLWIPTWEGLVRFDGSRFTVYNMANTPAFSTQAFTRLYVSHAGDIWFGAKNGMIYQYRDGLFIEHDALFSGHEGWINDFAEDAHGRLWVSENRGNLAYFDGQSWTLHPQRIREQFSPLVADANKRIWTYLPGPSPAPPDFIHFRDRIPARLDSVGFLPQASPETIGFSESNNGPIFHRPQGSILSYRREGRIRMDLLDAESTLLGWYWHTPTALASLIDSHGRVWTRHNSQQGNESILRVHKDGQLLAQIQPEGIGWVDSLVEDGEGNIWFKAKGGGLFRLQLSPFTQFSIDDGLVHTPAYIAASPNGEILVSSRGTLDMDKVSVFQGANISERKFRLLGSKLDLASAPNKALGQVQVDTNGQWWGVSYKHLLRLQEDVAEPVWRSDRGNIRVLYNDPAHPDFLWLGTTLGDLYRFNSRTLSVELAYKIGTSRIENLFRDSQQQLWIGTQNQLARLGPDGTLTFFANEAISRIQIAGFYEDADASLWIGTHDKGLVRYRDGLFQSVRTEHGLYEDTITSIFEDAFGYFWLSGNLGLQRVRLSELNALLDGQAKRVHAVGLPPYLGHYGIASELRGALQDDTGFLWYPSLRGISRVDPALYQEGFTDPPAVTIDDVRTEETTHAAQPGLTLTPQERRLTFTYGAISLRAADLLHFRYRLEGVDGDWIEAGGERRASYTNIEPGRYTFRVQAMNGGGVWSEEDAMLTFSVQPFFYETAWFYLLCGLGLLALSVSAFSYRLRYYKQQQKELDQLVQVRTHELAIEKQHAEQALLTVAEQSEQLKSLDEAKSRFFANISHEFRTPLQLILGPLEDLKDGLQGTLDADSYEHLVLAHRNSHRLLHLVNQLLDVSRLEMGRLALQIQPTEAVTYVNEIAGTFASMAKRKHIDFKVEALEDSIWVYLDPGQFEKVLINLLGNAFKFSPQEAEVSVRVATESISPDSSFFVLTVQDTGPGIAPEHLPHLFERFYQADSSTTRRQPGTGIGLALAQELVRLHHGTIDVASEPAMGTTFTVRLPLGYAHFSSEELVPSDPAATAQHVATATTPSQTLALDELALAGDGATLETTAHVNDDVMTVLIVDDNPEVRAYVRRHLHTSYRVLEAADGQQALDLARKVLPDLIVSDVMMPEMDGFALCQAIKRDRELDFIPVILLTAKASTDSKIAGLEEGADDYLTKPFDIRELSARIQNLITTRHRLKALLKENSTYRPSLSSLRETTPETSNEQTFAQQFQAVLEAFLSDEQISANTLVEAMGMSRSSLYRRVQDVYQLTPMELLWHLRLQHAAHLLRQPDTAVGEVAYGVGFRSVAHFSKRFSEHFGVTPSAFRADAQAHT